MGSNGTPVRNKVLTDQMSAVASIGSDVWDRLFSGPRSAELRPLVELNGPRRTAPATPGGLFFHIRAESPDVCLELADGDIIRAPAIDGALVLTTRGGDFESQPGTDVAIGYSSHDAGSAQLCLQETPAFLCHTAQK